MDRHLGRADHPRQSYLPRGISPRLCERSGGDVDGAGEFATADVINASVVLLSRAVEGVLVTSDPDDMRRLDPAIDLALC
ncbi:hypothetical protein [Pseudactinotalea sp. HY158]|uniref:hypothetical protein n=1 Tax=Pseudactinotalea sp. HY158 TaxID=2654547 RepID=UPI00129C546C|nr:hypothetical protein [Pseudactinotalea sp. HY158]QGH70515.1 hypothetical protein GCE65_14200 [Pseudactinotalea sp. HY158]